MVKIELIKLLIIVMLCPSSINIYCKSQDVTASNYNKHSAEKTKRSAAIFPTSSTVGIFLAIAVPIDLKLNCFYSHNFEANYNSPYLASHIIPGPFGRLGLSQKRSANNGNNKDISNAQYTVKQFLDRKQVYKILEKKIKMEGYNGKECLLKSICYAAQNPLGTFNGVIGDIFHIILTPTTSYNHNLSKEYYEAEYYGQMNMCHDKYHVNCKENLLDFISNLM